VYSGTPPSAPLQEALSPKSRTWCRRIIGEEEPEDVEDNTKEIEERERILYINLEEEVLRRNQVEERKVESKKKSFEETVLKEY